MSPERRQRKSSRFTLEEVTRIATEVALRDSGHAPTIIAQGSAGSVMGQILDLAREHEDKARQMFTAGHALGHTGGIGRLEEVFFISEGWMSVAQGDKPPRWPASQDPDRREVLFITDRKIESHQTRFVCLEMIRNTEGRLITLRPFQPTDLDEDRGRFDSPLLDAFMDGFRSGMARNN